jgi:hypothetical protein
MEFWASWRVPFARKSWAASATVYFLPGSMPLSTSCFSTSSLAQASVAVRPRTTGRILLPSGLEPSDSEPT